MLRTILLERIGNIYLHGDVLLNLKYNLCRCSPFIKTYRQGLYTVLAHHLFKGDFSKSEELRIGASMGDYHSPGQRHLELAAKGRRNKEKVEQYVQQNEGRWQKHVWNNITSLRHLCLLVNEVKYIPDYTREYTRNTWIVDGVVKSKQKGQTWVLFIASFAHFLSMWNLPLEMFTISVGCNSFQILKLFQMVMISVNLTWRDASSNLSTRQDKF